VASPSDVRVGRRTGRGIRIGLISDVHGNLPALEAVLSRLEEDGVDRIVCLGDLATGPWPSATVKRLAAIDAACIVGNWDAWVLDGVPPCGDGDACRKLLEMSSYWASQLDDDDTAFMRRATETLTLDEGGGVRFFHGSPRSYNEPLLAATPNDELARMLSGHASPCVVVGHTHVQMLRRLPSTVLVNPGSVGLPFREWPISDAQVCPWAEYGVLELGDGRFGVELRRTGYDARAVLEHTRASDVPHADWWADCWDLELR
jgi:predicted phosphodiesterase